MHEIRSQAHTDVSPPAELMDGGYDGLAGSTQCHMHDRRADERRSRAGIHAPVELMDTAAHGAIGARVDARRINGMQAPMSVIDGEVLTRQHLIRRRHANANPALPLRFDPEPTVRSILATVAQVATASRTVARREENKIYCWYEGWLPDDDEKPTTKWEQQWAETGLVRNVNPSVQIDPPRRSARPTARRRPLGPRRHGPHPRNAPQLSGPLN